MYKVLINAYSVSPGRGSEPGMGWNWIINLARHCELFIITEAEWQDKIDAAVTGLPQRHNMHFFYNKMPESAREMSRNQGDWRFYYYYRQWQKEALKIAEKILAEHDVDLIHQLNMIGYREPGFLWKIPDVPYVWGPIGGLSQFPVSYLRNAGLKQNFTKRLKNVVNTLQLHFSPRVRAAVKRSDALIAATSEGRAWLHGVFNKDVFYLNETGCYVKDDAPPEVSNKKTLDLLWCGRFYFRKQLNLALKTMSQLKHLPQIRLHILGDGSGDDDALYRKMAEDLGVASACVWHGSIPQNEVFDLMKQFDIFFFTSLEEGTPHVVLEAIQHNLPVICFNNCGHGDSVDDTVGRKIPITDPEDSIERFAAIIEHFCHNRNELEQLSANCRAKQRELSWERKIRKMLEIYQKAIEQKEKSH